MAEGPDEPYSVRVPDFDRSVAPRWTEEAESGAKTVALVPGRADYVGGKAEANMTAIRGNRSPESESRRPGEAARPIRGGILCSG